jgi:cell division protein FtsQ
MRRLNGGPTIQIDQGFEPLSPSSRPSSPGQRKKRSAPSRRLPRRLVSRWPGALRSLFIRRLALLLLLLLSVLTAVMAFPAHQIGRQIVSWSARAGFIVDDIFVEGRAKTPRDELLSALGIKRGDAIFAIDLAEARRHIEAIPWVRSAVVERRLPNKIHLLITERSPIALWQNKGRYFLVDHDGQIVGDQIDDYPDLPLTVGEGAPDHVAQLVTLLQSEPSLQGRVKAAAWVGDRRWNVTLDRAPDGIEIRLPEEAALAAWHDLARLESEQQLLERQISVVDMRQADRLVLRAATAPHDLPHDPLHDAGSGKHKPTAGKDA